MLKALLLNTADREPEGASAAAHAGTPIAKVQAVCTVTIRRTRPIEAVGTTIDGIAIIAAVASSRKEDTGGLGGAGGTIKPSSMLAIFLSPVTFIICIANQCI